MPQNGGGGGRDYRESDVTVVLGRGAEWNEWSQAVSWLRQEGIREDQTRSGHVRDLMMRDFEQLQRDGVPFTHEPGEAFKLARSHRPRHVAIKGDERHSRRR